MTRPLSVALAFAAIVVFAAGAGTTAADRNIGTWKLNVAKSRFDPDRKPKNQTLTIEEWGADGVKYTADGADADGRPTHVEFQAKYDGKFVTLTGSPDANALSIKRINANKFESTTQLNGKQMSFMSIVFSEDGKTRTLTQIGKNAVGHDVHNTIVYDKQ
jgi:hypothetical protein